ncbi:MAG: hypothetical protein ACRENO_09100 [Thermodesulfobacteriota bacterium]
MSKREVKINLYQCDHADESGTRCDLEGERQAIKQCALCKTDLCSRHYEYLSVTRHGGVYLSYFFCPKHSDEFMDTLIKTFGDTRPIITGGMAK